MNDAASGDLPWGATIGMSKCAWIKCLNIGRQKKWNTWSTGSVDVKALPSSPCPFYRYSCPQGWLQHKVPKLMCLVVLTLLHYILCFAVNNYVRLAWIPNGCICTVICCYWYVFTYFVAYLHWHMHNAAGICVLAHLINYLSFC